jgi:hypothetical protein
MVLADYEAYVERQGEVGHAWTNPARWDPLSILNVARIGRFSSDRAIRDYSQRIWKVEPVRCSESGAVSGLARDGKVPRLSADTCPEPSSAALGNCKACKPM